MIIALLVGLVLGFLLAIPPGPIGMMSVKFGLERGPKQTVEYALGTAGMDMIFSMIAIFTASALESYITRLSVSNQLYMLIFQFAVVIGLVGFGIAVLKSNKKKLSGDFEQNKGLEKFEFVEKWKTKGAFIFGVAFALTNLANPAFLPFLGILSIQVHKLNIIDNSFAANMIFAIGFGIGNFFWINVLSRLVMKYRDKMTKKAVVNINRFAGITFISFAGVIIYRVLTVTKWTDILKFAF